MGSWLRMSFVAAFFLAGCNQPQEVKGEWVSAPLEEVSKQDGRCSFRLYYQEQLLTYSVKDGTTGQFFEKCSTLRKGDQMIVIKTTRFVNGKKEKHWYHWRSGDIFDKLM